MKTLWKTKYYWFLFISVIAIFSVATGFFLTAGEIENGSWWSHINGFFAAFGLIGCAVIVMIAKWLGKYWLQRKEDYYD